MERPSQEPMRLKDQVALVTGAGRGIGRAIAVRFAQEGALVGVNDIESSVARAVADAIDERNLRSLAVPGDVSRGSEVEEMVRRTVDRFGRIDILVACAGVRSDLPFHRLPEEEWDRVLETNLKGSFLCARAVEPHMAERNQGNLLFFSSPVPSGVRGRGHVHYAASSAGVEGLTRALAVEMGPFHIRVNCICPEYIETEMTRVAALRAGMYLDDLKRLIVAEIPLRRLGRAEEVANLAVFLASEESGYITGQVIRICGGP